MRINKLFSNYGICSRKETNKLIEEKRVKVNGEFCVLGQWVEINKDEILLDDKPISMKKKVYIALNKPVGIICTAQNKVKDNIINFMKYHQYIFPVGRLDKESQGLIIMTNDGDLASGILESENLHEKEYIVKVHRTFDEKFLKQMSEGVEILENESSGIKRISDTLGVCKIENDKELELGIGNLHKLSMVQLKNLKQNKINKKNIIRTRPCKVSRLNENTFKIILTQGLNKQIRKMSGALGYKVTKLERVRIMNISITGIEVGKWRELYEEEVRNLKMEVNNKTLGDKGDNEMNKEYINAMEAAKKYNLFLKVVTSVKSFDSYNSFFNIYDEAEEPCRRIIVLTKNKELEEVYDENSTEKVDECKIIDGNIWIKDYSLLVSPHKIDLSALIVNKRLVEEIL